METFAEPSAGGAATQAAKYVAMEFKKPTPLDSIEKAYDIRCKGPDGLAQLNTENVTISNIPLYDMRSIVDTLSLDVQGFLVVDLPSRMNYADFFDEEKLRTVYAEEIRSYLLDSLGATCVFFHECVVRKRSKDGKEKNGYGEPAPKAHGGKWTVNENGIELTFETDYTLKEIAKILGVLGGENVAKELKTRRYQALNIWRPLRGPVRDWPLALCDLRTVESKDMIPMDEVFVDDVIESYQVHYEEKQRWYYLKDQRVSECLVFKSADSAIHGTVPHCSFFNPDTPQDEPGRESIELRALIIY